ncbi:hypothetical protein AURDEDRAFT_159333 [Auricularia subglabra TFB-10046 SS5]|nr:hypothetical protein AURDEDRAFT_159333 [Auricularia subglabra TFB-10046 SS5]
MVMLDVCERLHISLSAIDETQQQYPYHEDVVSVLCDVANCVAPKLTHLDIVVGDFNSCPRTRYVLYVPLFEPGKAPVLESFTTNCIKIEQYFPQQSRRIAVLRLSGGSYSEARLFIDAHHVSLRTILLYEMDVDLYDIQLQFLALRTLCVTGASVDLLSCLRLAFLPQLSYLILAFNSEHDAAVQLATFVQQHPETVLRRILLRGFANPASFKDFIPALASMTQLRSLRLGGIIEVDFFLHLSQVMPQTLADRLEELAIEYTAPLDSLVPGLRRFLATKLRLIRFRDFAVHKLDFIRAGGPPDLTPFDYDTTEEWTEVAPRHNYRIAGRLAADLLDNMDYWRPECSIAVVASALMCCLTVVSQAAGPYSFGLGGYVNALVWAIMLGKDAYTAATVGPTVYPGGLWRSIRTAFQLAKGGKCMALLKHVQPKLQLHTVLALFSCLMYFLAVASEP